MSQATHLFTDHGLIVDWFECPRCGARQAVASQLWHSVEVLGEKPTLDVCEHRPHVPPSPAALRAFAEDKALADLLLATYARNGPAAR